MSRGFQQPNSDSQSRPGAPRGSLVRGSRPRVPPQIFEDRFDRKGAIPDSHEKRTDRRRPTTLLLLLLLRPIARRDIQQLLDPLGTVVFRPFKCNGLVALTEADLVDEHVGAEGY